MSANVLSLIILLFASALATAPAQAKFEKDQKAIAALLAKRHYASAAFYINNRPDLLKEPRFLRQMSHILVNYYTTAISFRLFALKDLEEGERLEDLRGATGTYQIVGGDLEKTLHEALKANPDSADINFAVGEYISRGQSCRCGTPELFAADNAAEYRYFDLAYKGGVYDYWSLFRMGNYHLSTSTGDIKQAISLYKKSIELNPSYTESNFNLSSAYYWTKDYELAKSYAEKTLGQYRDPDLDADTYTNYARIEAALGNRASAEKSFLKAFEFKQWHDSAFTGLIDLYRADKRLKAYKKAVKDFIALEYGNTYTFNVYVDYLARAQITDTDREIVRELAAQEFSDPKEIGAVFFNLGRIAEMDGEEGLALQHYNKSLDALKKLTNAPAGSVEALEQLIARVKSKDARK